MHAIVPEYETIYSFDCCPCLSKSRALCKESEVAHSNGGAY